MLREVKKREEVKLRNPQLNMIMPKISPVRCTILALNSRCLKERTTQKYLQRAPVWSWPNTLRRLSQKCFYNSRVLERS